jgi:hypothetical protein
MMRILQFFGSSLLVLSMTGCMSNTAPVENSAGTPGTSVTSTAISSTSQTAGFVGMQGVITSTKTAIEAGKLDVAKTEFAKFEDSWKTVEDGVKAKSADNYKGIEDGMESVNGGIAAKAGKDKLLASLQKLSQSVDKAGK